MEEDFLIEGKVGPIEIEALFHLLRSAKAPIRFASFDCKTMLTLSWRNSEGETLVLEFLTDQC